MQRLGAVTLALGLAGISGFGALLALLWGLELKCDDSCGTPPPWRDDPDAWQWTAFAWVGVAGFIWALLFLVAVALGRKVAASVALVTWAGLAIAFLKLFEESGLTSHEARGWAALAALVLLGVTAIALLTAGGERLRSKW